MNDKNRFGNFPDPSAPSHEKNSKAYGKKYARAILEQWGGTESASSLFQRRQKEFENNRDYAQGTQSTRIYKQILNSLDPTNGDGTLMNLDWTPVPIVPKFVKIVVNKILSRRPYPNVEAVDPLSQQEKEKKKSRVVAAIENRQFLEEARQAGATIKDDIDNLPDTVEEAEVFLDTNIKIAAEIAAQLATSLTLEWNDFNDTTYRRSIEDLVVNGMAVIKRENDPNHGIVERYVDPAKFIHSYTEDPSMKDLVYGAEVRNMSILDLKRIAKGITEDQWKKIATLVKDKYGNNPSRLGKAWYDQASGRNSYGYDEFRVAVLDFEFIGLDQHIYEEKQSQYGNVGFYYKGEEYKMPTQSVFDRKPFYMDIMCVYSGLYIEGADMLLNYGKMSNQPRNIHDISRTTMSYSAVCTNIRRMMPKSMVSGITGFADQLQLTHLKIQQAIAKAKPDGIIIDIEGLENVQLGTGGELSPLDLQDIYEQTGVMYYRGKNPEGGHQNPPIQPIQNTIRNINELIALYNHYLRMIRDATGINEVMDGSTPKGDALVGVREQQMAAANNAIYDITHSSLVLYKAVCSDIVKCLQILPKKSVLYKTYVKAIGKDAMGAISEFEKLPMYNFGIRVVTEMSDADRAYLEHNINQSLAQKELDIEDAIAIRRLNDIDQAERLLVIRRKKRMKRIQEQAAQNSQMQAQANMQSAQAKAEADAQLEQVRSQLRMQELNMKAEIDLQLKQLQYQYELQIEQLKGQNAQAVANASQTLKRDIHEMAEDRKDERVKKQAVEQSKLISQRRGERGELPADETENDFLNQFLQ